MTSGRIALIFIETQSNPMSSLVDIVLVRRISEDIGRKQGFRPTFVATTRSLGRFSSRRSGMGPIYRFIR